VSPLVSPKILLTVKTDKMIEIARCENKIVQPHPPQGLIPIQLLYLGPPRTKLVNTVNTK
jgi:hypothetical protein